MQAGLEMRVAQEDWENAASAAGNLSELALALGDVAGALRYAEQSVDLADRSGDAFQRMGKRTTLADALHQAGEATEARSAVRRGGADAGGAAAGVPAALLAAGLPVLRPAAGRRGVSRRCCAARPQTLDMC